MGARRFEPFLAEVEARINLYGGNADQALSVISKAWQKVNELSIQHFIGPWVLATKALIIARRISLSSDRDTHTSEEVFECLNDGAQLLAEGCVGHNYYRYWVAAIDALLLLGEKDKALDALEKFKQYANSEPIPWTEYYLQRFHLLIESQLPDSQVHKVDSWRKFEERSKRDSFFASLAFAEIIRPILPVHSNVATP